MKKLLICDDSNFSRKRIIDMIKSDDFEIIEAQDGQQALDKINDKNPDLVLLDLLMPKITGIELLKILKEKNINVPVIVISADIQESTKQECKKLGAIEFLNKPPQKEVLNNSIKAIIDN
ncbi:MAG: response regulator [Ignavibacteria bacterium]|jgi:twitching motility two-component system response regulator PilH